MHVLSSSQKDTCFFLLLLKVLKSNKNDNGKIEVMPLNYSISAPINMIYSA